MDAAECARRKCPAGKHTPANLSTAALANFSPGYALRRAQFVWLSVFIGVSVVFGCSLVRRLIKCSFDGISSFLYKHTGDDPYLRVGDCTGHTLPHTLCARDTRSFTIQARGFTRSELNVCIIEMVNRKRITPAVRLR